jgi:hypothetical protein
MVGLKGRSVGDAGAALADEVKRTAADVGEFDFAKVKDRGCEFVPGDEVWRAL